MEVHFRLGVIRLREKKKEKAQEHFKKVEELDKDDKKRTKEHIAWAKLKLLLADKKRQAEAKKAARELVDKFPKGMYLSKCLMIIADICIKERDIDGAVDAWLELQKKRFGSIEYPEMKKLLNKYWNQSKHSKK
jgi:tetratricopeptide (TPR) repeat protein